MGIAQESFELWGGEATVAVARPEHLAAARAVVDRVIGAVDKACSSYREDSDLARVNAAAGQAVAVGGTFLDVLRAAIRAAELTGGLVDPTGAGRGEGALTAAGASGTGSGRDDPGGRPRGLPRAARSELRSIRVYTASAGSTAPRTDGLRDLRRVLPGAVGGALRSTEGGVAACNAPRPDDLHGRPRAVPSSPRLDWRSIRIDPVAGTVRIPAELSLDFGAVGKAFAADRAAAQAVAETGCGVLVALAGDIAVAGRVPTGGWRVRVTDDHRRGVGGEPPPGQDIVLHAPGGLATSSLTVRTRRMPDGGTVNHIVDPRTGMPVVGPWRTVSVSAATCVDANTASTAALVDGHGAGGRLAADGLPARLVHADGWVHTVAGWPTDHSERPGVKVAG